MFCLYISAMCFFWVVDNIIFGFRESAKYLLVLVRIGFHYSIFLFFVYYCHFVKSSVVWL